jgi:hypothetical protein
MKNLKNLATGELRLIVLLNMIVKSSALTLTDDQFNYNIGLLVIGSFFMLLTVILLMNRMFSNANHNPANVHAGVNIISDPNSDPHHHPSVSDWLSGNLSSRPIEILFAFFVGSILSLNVLSSDVTFLRYWTYTNLLVLLVLLFPQKSNDSTYTYWFLCWCNATGLPDMVHKVWFLIYIINPLGFAIYYSIHPYGTFNVVFLCLFWIATIMYALTIVGFARRKSQNRPKLMFALESTTIIIVFCVNLTHDIIQLKLSG